MSPPIRLKDHAHDQHLIHSRLLVAVLFVVLLLSMLIMRMYHLQVVQYEYHSTLAENNRIHVQPLPPTRGLIYDRNGVILAENRPSFSLTLTRERVGDLQQVLQVICEVLELDAEAHQEFTKRVMQARRPFEPVPILFELSEQQIARIAVNQYRLPGVEVDAHLVRNYPQGKLFAHSVGYVGRINEDDLERIERVNYSGTHHIGKIGIERFYEEQLHGEVGYEEVESNARGRVLRVLHRNDARSGKDLYLTLDYELQKAATQIMSGMRGSIVALTPDTGEILAMVSEPGFEPNLFVTGISFKDYGELRDSLDQPLFNRAQRGLYPPGSTIKPMVLIAGLDAGVITPSTRVFDPGFFQLPNNTHKYRNWFRPGDGWVNLELAMARSNDTYFYDLAFKLGIDQLSKYMNEFGFGQRVALDVFGESAGLMPSREWKRERYRQAWYPGETVIAGIGQGYMQSTPLQLAYATGLVATKGKRVRPHLVKAIDDVAVVDPQPHKDMVLTNSAHWDVVQASMESVMHGRRGTARAVGKAAEYRIAGKTGTAQVVAIRQGEKYDRDALQARHRDHALFVGYAPADDPQIAIAVVIENGESGSAVAAPMAKAVMDAWLLREQGAASVQLEQEES